MTCALFESAALMRDKRSFPHTSLVRSSSTVVVVAAAGAVDTVCAEDTGGGKVAA